MSHTLEMCQDHPPYEVAAFFLFGRENLIPDMFRKIVEGLAESENASIDAFRYYLDRHIGIDEEEHGPASVRMMKSMCGDNDMRWRLVKRAAEESLIARIKLWDGIAEAIDSGKTSGHDPCRRNEQPRPKALGLRTLRISHSVKVSQC